MLQVFDLMFQRRHRQRQAVWLSLSDQETDDLVRLGVDPAKIRPIQNLVPDIGLRADYQPNQNCITFSFISRLHSRKQPTVFVQAAAKVMNSNPAVRARIIGPDQGEGRRVDREIRASPFPARFVVTGPLPHESVIDELHRTDVLVLPSVGEVAPMIVLESASAGTPIILTDDCAIAPELGAASAAIIATPTVDGVAAAMQRALDSGLRTQLARNARQHYERNWAPAKVGEDLEAVYAYSRGL